jgi:hypothetical protein
MLTTPTTKSHFRVLILRNVVSRNSEYMCNKPGSPICVTLPHVTLLLQGEGQVIPLQALTGL